MHWIVVEDASGNKESAEAWTKIIYSGQLNGTHAFEILLESSSAAYRTKFQRGFKVYIYRGKTLKLTGTIIKISNTSTGLMRIRGMGYCDRQLDKPNAPSTTWTGQDNTTIVTAIMAKVSGVTEGSIAAYSGNPIASFRTGVNETCLQAIKRVNERTGQDWSFDYVNNELDIEDHKGSASSITTLNEGVDISGVTDTGDDINKIMKVTVIGKNEGTQQISATKTHGSYAQGDNEISLVDKSIDTNAEAQLRADLEYAARVDTAQSVQFTVDNPGLSFVLGDVITINSASTGTDADRRITSFKRVIVPDQELLRLETRGTGERESSTDRLRELALEKRSIRDANVLKQGTDTGTGNISDSGHDHTQGSYAAVAHTHSADGTLEADTHGSGDNGYQYSNYLHNPTGDNTWRSVGTTVNTGAYTYLFHGIFGFFRFSMSVAGSTITQNIFVRAKNTTDTSYYPSSTGLHLQSGWSAYGLTHRHTNPEGGFTGYTSEGTQFTCSLPFYIHIPYNWTSKNYVLEYKIDNQTGWYVATDLRYAYHGSYGHTHDVKGDSGSTTPAVSGTSDSGTASVTDAGHTH